MKRKGTARKTGVKKVRGVVSWKGGESWKLTEVAEYIPSWTRTKRWKHGHNLEKHFSATVSWKSPIPAWLLRSDS